MTKKQVLAYSILGAVTGIILLPGVFQWLGIWPSFSRLLYWLLGEPTPINKALIGLGAGVLLYTLGRNFYKKYKNAK